MPIGLFKKAIHTKLYPKNISRDSGIKIPEAWMPTIKKHSSQSRTNRTCQGTTSILDNSEDLNVPIGMNVINQSWADIH